MKQSQNANTDAPGSAPNAQTQQSGTAMPTPASAPPSTASGEKPRMINAFFLFQSSYDALKTNVSTIVGLTLTPLLASIPIFAIIVFFIYTVSSVAEGTAPTQGMPAGVGITIVLVYLCMIFLSIITSSAMITASLKAARNERIRYTKAFAIGWKNVWRFLLLCLLVSLVVGIGFILLIVPGLFMLRRYLLSPYYLIDRNLGILDAMAKSAEDSKQYGGIWSLLIVVVLISLLAVIPYIGWILSLALGLIYMCAPAIRYLQITKASGLDPADPTKPLKPAQSPAV